MKNQQSWPPVIREAMELAMKQANEPVLGARLQYVLKKVAADRGLEFPPVHGMRLLEFLTAFPESVSVIRRPQQDFLAVLPNQPELLAGGNPAPHIRQNLFAALTRIPRSDQRVGYDRANDKVVWFAVNDPPPDRDLVLFPLITEGSELDLRRQFAAEIPKDDLRMNLLGALEGAQPFSAFSKAVHESGLGGNWQDFLRAKVFQRLHQWAQENGVPWQDSWLESDNAPRSPTPDQESLARARLGTLVVALQSLTDADLGRISVPLDVVAKLLRHPR